MAKRVKSSANKQNGEQSSMDLNNERKLEQQINPLFVDALLENIISFLKSNTLGECRLVCKFWDQEIIKMIRRKTHVKLHRILTPYPEGFGWTDVKGENKFKYKVPYQQVHSFENVEVAIGVRWVKNYKYVDEKFEKWFKVMGHEIRSLIYICSLKTYQKKYYTTLEKILKEWCPNLERLTLRIEKNGCLKGLIFTSLFEDTTREIFCKDLTEINVRVNLDDFTWHETSEVPNILFDPKDFTRFIYNYGLPYRNDECPEISNPAGIKVTVSKALYSNTELPNLSKIIPENFFPEYLDGGILGQLMKQTNVKKLTLGGNIASSNRKHLVAFFHYRQNKWRNSLKHLEIDFIGKFEGFTNDLAILGKVKFPIVTLKLALKRCDGNSADFTRFLLSLSETLKHLNIHIHVIPYMITGMVVLPLLPKLKTFTIDQISIGKLSAANLVENAPNLEKCYLTEVEIFGSKNLDTFYKEDSSFSNEHLKDFRLTGNNVNFFSGEHASKLLDWFPKVKRLELIGIRDENIGVMDFLEKLSNSEVTQFKMGWCRSKRSLKATIADDTALIQEIGKLQNLVSLEMIYEHENVPIHVVPIAIRDGFGKLSNLRYLKLTNFGISTHEKREIMKSVEHIPLVNLCLM